MTLKTWNIDTSHSSISFAVRHMVFAKVRGRFSSWRGELHLDTADLTRSEVEVSIDATSIDTGVADRDNHLRSPDFLDAEQFPELSFKSTRIEGAGDRTFRLHGELTIHGASRPVSLEVEYGGQAKDPWGNQRVAFAATTAIDRRDFGLSWNQVLEAGGVLVGEKIEIELEIQAVAAAASQAAQ
ncbi:MAG: YceI family protein [Myxococcales bacterium]|nr:YceI family protein [Myxococcales bacterium]